LETKTLNVELLSKMFLGGAKNLEAKKEYINELNVFPVPDGDTGTNMTLTILSAANEVSALSEPDMRSLAKAISSGSLRGARGNSGVILSQLLRGFSKVIAEHENTIDVPVIAEAFTRAVETAYKAVMKPKEGTILTVARCTAERAAELAQTETDIVTFAEEIIKQAEQTLEKTPDLLPVLKQAGVVDSGGQGLLEMLRGAYDVLCGKEVDYTSEAPASSGIVKISAQTEEEIRFGYCTEFIIVLNNELSAEEVTGFKAFLESIGDSIVVVADEEIVKVHVHTNDPGEAISKALTYGSLSKIKIDNMREEHQEKLIKDAARIAKQQKEEDEAAKAQAAKEADTPKPAAGAPEKEMGFICVSIGDGLNQIFKDLGVDYVIEGGQTMNPSTEDILNAVEQVSAEHVFVLPNNKNIILAANQAAAICEEKHIIVIPTKTVPQGITALINYVPESTVDENIARMTEEIGFVSTGQVTYAVRDTVIDDKEIKQGDFMGIGDSSILSVGKDRDETLFDMLDCMVDDDSEIISIYYGEDVDEEAAQAASKEAEKRYPDCEIELHYGGQPIYYYVISVE
jgi:hypothetical protein